jgi:hypothetical protein
MIESRAAKVLPQDLEALETSISSTISVAIPQDPPFMQCREGPGLFYETEGQLFGSHFAATWSNRVSKIESCRYSRKIGLQV